MTAILLNSLWVAVFSTGLGMIMTTPVRALVSCFVCGFMGRLVRDLLMAQGLNRNWSTAISVAMLVVFAGLLVRGKRIAPVVLICAIFPLGFIIATFNSIFDFMRVATLKGEALSAASVALSADAGQAIVGTLAIAVGLTAGIALVALFKRGSTDGV